MIRRSLFIWDIIRDYFEANGCPWTVALDTNYELQNPGAARWASSTSPGTRRWHGWMLSGSRAWTCRAIAMRDTDRDRVFA